MILRTMKEMMRIALRKNKKGRAEGNSRSGEGMIMRRPRNRREPNPQLPRNLEDNRKASKR